MIRSTNRRSLATWTTCALLAVPLLAACTDNTAAGSSTGDSGDGRALSVAASDTACALSAGTAPSGNLSFTVKNDGAQVTEF